MTTSAARAQRDLPLRFADLVDLSSPTTTTDLDRDEDEDRRLAERLRLADLDAFLAFFGLLLLRERDAEPLPKSSLRRSALMPLNGVFPTFPPPPAMAPLPPPPPPLASPAAPPPLKSPGPVVPFGGLLGNANLDALQLSQRLLDISWAAVLDEREALRLVRVPVHDDAAAHNVGDLSELRLELLVSGLVGDAAHE